MDEIYKELASLKAEFASLESGFDRYCYLVELAGLLPGFPGLEDEENLYPGCQSKVWLRVSSHEGRLRFEADSDTLIIRGILYLFWALLNGAETEQVWEARFDLLTELGLSEHFSSQRTASIGGLLPEIQRRLKNGL